MAAPKRVHPDAYFEYVDDRGRTHRVDDLSKVPKKYLRKMLVVGIEPPKETGAEAPGAPGGANAGGGAVAGLPDLGAGAIVLLAALIVALKTRNFLVRTVAVAATILYMLYSGWDLFLASKFSKTAEKASAAGESRAAAREAGPAQIIIPIESE